MFFQGTLISPKHNYVHFEILACNQTILNDIPGYEKESCFSNETVATFMKDHFLIGYVENTFVDQEVFNENPVKSLNDLAFYDQLKFEDHIRKDIYLNYNEVQLKDHYFQIWDRY